MSQDGHVNRVSKGLKEKRFVYYYKYILHGKSVGRYGEKYEEIMWNSGDTQFFALWTKKTHRREEPYLAGIDIFRYYYSILYRGHGNRIEKAPGGVLLSKDQIANLHDFLSRKPTGETFIIPSHKGNYHLSFEKRSLLGGVELRWKFLHSQEEWGYAHQLPRKKRKDVVKDFKQNEQRQRFWFDNTQIKTLSSYLRMLLAAMD